MTVPYGATTPANDLTAKKAATPGATTTAAQQTALAAYGGASPVLYGAAGATGGDAMSNSMGLTDPGQVEPGGGYPGYNPPNGSGSVAGVGTQQYGPDNNLIGTAIMPMDSERLGTYGGYVDKAAQGVSDFQYQPWQSMGPLSNQGTQQMQGIQNTGYQNAGQTNMAPAMGYLNGSTQTGAGGSAAQSALMGMLGGGGGGGFSYGGPQADVGKARASAMSSLQDAMTGPDRTALATQAFQLMRDQGQKGFEQDQRAVGQRAAALGRVGAGMTTNDLTGLAQSRDNSLNFASRDLALQAADKTLADKIARTQLAQGVAQGFSGEDRADAGLNLQGAALGEQSAARIAGNQLSAAGQLTNADQFNRSNLRGIGNDVFNMGATNTQERGADANRNINTDQFNRNLDVTKANSQINYDTNAYDRAVNERDSSRKDEFNRDNMGMNRLSSLSGLQNNQRSFEANNRNEVRGERGYQNDQSQQAQNNAIQQQQFNEWLRNSGWNRAMGAGSMGFGGDPSGAMQNAANNASGQAAASGAAAGNLMGSYFANQQRQQPFSYNNLPSF